MALEAVGVWSITEFLPKRGTNIHSVMCKKRLEVQKLTPYGM